MLRNLLAATAASSMLLSSAAWAQPATPVDADALAFGTRESVSDMDLSPDGNRAVFVGAVPGGTTVVYLIDIAAGTTNPILVSKADPEALSWCGFASNVRLACRFGAIIKTGDGLIPAARMIALDLNGKNVKELGQRASSSGEGG